MTGAVHKITPPNPARDERHIALGKKAEDWEGDVCDVANMAEVSITVLEATMNCSSGAASGFPDMYMMTREQVNQIAFVLYQSNRLAVDFKRKFYDAIKAN